MSPAINATRDQALDFLRKHPMGVLSTVSKDGKPWGAAIYFVADEDLNCYFAVRNATHKYKNLTANKHAAITVADSTTQSTVQIAGSIERVPAKDTLDVVFKRLAGLKPKHATDWMPPIIKVHEGDWVVLRLKPAYAQFANFASHKKFPDDQYLTQVYP